MRITKEPVALHYDGPLPDGRDVPQAIFYDVVLSVQHTAADAEQAVSTALAPLAGKPRRRGFMRRRLEWSDERWPLDVRVGPAEIEVRVGHRLKGNGLRRLVTALAAVPGARELHVEANSPGFADAFADVRACTPCMAAAMSPAR